MILTIAAAAFAFLGADAHADDHGKEVEMSCKAYQAEYGGSADCACLGKKAAEDEQTAKDLMMIQSPADVEKATEKAMMAIGACSA